MSFDSVNHEFTFSLMHTMNIPNEYHWNDTCIGKLISHLVLQAFQLPTVMEEIRMNTKINIDGKQIPKYSQRATAHQLQTLYVGSRH